MKKIFKKSIIAIMVVLFSATMAMAGNAYKTGPKGGSKNCPYDCPYDCKSNCK